MPVESEKAMDYTIVGLENTYCFLDDIIIISTGSEADHLRYVTKCLKKLDDDNLRISLQKCYFAKQKSNGLAINLARRVYHQLKIKPQLY